MAGGVRRHAALLPDHFIGHWPDDVRITHVSRTVGSTRVVDEMVMHFTHDMVMDTFLPGVAPTGRTVALPVVVVVGFDGDKVASEQIYWDQASLLVQIGLLDPSLLPVCGAEQAAKVLDEGRPCNALIERRLRTRLGGRCHSWRCRRRTAAPRRECR